MMLVFSYDWMINYSFTLLFLNTDNTMSINFREKIGLIFNFRLRL